MAAEAPAASTASFQEVMETFLHSYFTSQETDRILQELNKVSIVRMISLLCPLHHVLTLCAADRRPRRTLWAASVWKTSTTSARSSCHLPATRNEWIVLCIVSLLLSALHELLAVALALHESTQAHQSSGRQAIQSDPEHTPDGTHAVARAPGTATWSTRSRACAADRSRSRT